MIKIDVAKRNSFCRYHNCQHNNRILKGDKRVDCVKFYYGYAHPNCALKILNEKIKSFVDMRTQFLKDNEIELVTDEL